MQGLLPKVKNLSLVIVFLFAIWVTSCRPSPVDPELAQYQDLKTEQEVKNFLAHPADEQIEIYLRVAAVPRHPSNTRLAKPIATQDGDIGPLLIRRLRSERNEGRLQDLIFLAGDYCNLNRSCRGETHLLEAVEEVYGRFADSWKNNVAIHQSIDWVRASTKRVGDRFHK